MRITRKIRDIAWTALRTAMHIDGTRGVKSVEQLYKEQVLDVMDDRGMLPAAKCMGCGKELNADGNHPLKDMRERPMAFVIHVPTKDRS